MKRRIPIEFEGEYAIRVMDMPLGAKGCIIYDDDDFANIYLNARYSREANVASADHEIVHMLEDDIHNTDDIRAAEARAGSRAAKPASIPALFRARDLLPPQAPEPAAPAKPAPDLSPYQARVLASALSELDRFVFAADPVRAGMEL